VVGIPQVTLYSFVNVRTVRETPHSQKIGLMQADLPWCISGRCYVSRSVIAAIVYTLEGCCCQGFLALTISIESGWLFCTILVEPRGLEPLTPSLQRRCSPN